MIEFLIVTALQKEFGPLRNVFKAKRLPKDPEDSYQYYEATVDTKTGLSYSIRLVCAGGKGPKYTIAALSAAIPKWNPKYVIMTGIAATIPGDRKQHLKQRRQIGHILVADLIVDLSEWKVLPSGEEARPEIVDCDSELVRSVHLFLLDDRPRIKAHLGIIVAQPSLIRSAKIRKKLVDKAAKVTGRTDVIGIEMEGGGIGTGVKMQPRDLTPGLIMIKGAVDFANYHKRDEAQKPAAHAAAKFVRDFLVYGPVGKGSRHDKRATNEIPLEPLGRVPYREPAFLAQYLQCFVGRDDAIRVVKDLVALGQGGYLLLEGPAGFGKTALITKLVELGEGGKIHTTARLLYFFIRQQRDRHTAKSFLEALNQQLVDTLKIEQPIAVLLPELERQWWSLWEKAQRATSAQNKLVFLVDGLDEMAVNGLTIADYLPSSLPPHIYFVITSRPSPPALLRVPDHHLLRMARVHCLDRFGSQEVRELLALMGDRVQRKETFIDQVLKVTKGEPLYLRFLCEDIAVWGERAQEMLSQMPEGVEKYFRLQFTFLRTQVQGKPYEKTVFDTLGLLVLAKAPLTEEDLAGALNTEKRAVKSGIEQIRRFLLGEGSYELMHPQFMKVADEWFGKDEKRGYLRQLLTYCSRWQEQKSDYALRYYTAHLIEAGLVEQLHDLLNTPFVQFKACQSYSDIVDDLDRGIQAAKKAGNEALPKAVKYLLILAGIRSHANLLPIKIFAAMAKLGQGRRAAGFINLIVDPINKNSAWIEILKETLDPRSARDLRQMEQMLEPIDDPYFRSEALAVGAEVMGRSDPEEAKRLLRRSLEEASRIGGPFFTTQKLLSIAQKALSIEPALTIEALERALELTKGFRTVNEDVVRSLMLIASVFEQVAPGKDEAIIRETLDEVNKKKESDKCLCLAAMAEGLKDFKPEIARGLLELNLDLIKQVEQQYHRAVTEHPEASAHILKVLRATKSSMLMDTAIAMSYFDSDRAVELCNSIEDEYDKALAYLKMAPILAKANPDWSVNVISELLKQFREGPARLFLEHALPKCLGDIVRARIEFGSDKATVNTMGKVIAISKTLFSQDQQSALAAIAYEVATTDPGLSRSLVKAVLRDTSWNRWTDLRQSQLFQEGEDSPLMEPGPDNDISYEPAEADTLIEQVFQHLPVAWRDEEAVKDAVHELIMARKMCHSSSAYFKVVKQILAYILEKVESMPGDRRVKSLLFILQWVAFAPGIKRKFITMHDPHWALDYLEQALRLTREFYQGFYEQTGLRCFVKQEILGQLSILRASDPAEWWAFAWRIVDEEAQWGSDDLFSAVQALAPSLKLLAGSATCQQITRGLEEVDAFFKQLNEEVREGTLEAVI